MKSKASSIINYLQKYPRDDYLTIKKDHRDKPEQDLRTLHALNDLNRPFSYKQPRRQHNGHAGYDVGITPIYAAGPSINTCGVVREPREGKLSDGAATHGADSIKYLRRDGLTSHKESVLQDGNTEAFRWWYSKSVMVSLWSMPEQKVVLACRLTNTHPKTGCQWKSPNQILIATTNLTNRFTVIYNISSGICTITFIPVKVDLGEWSCIFNAEDSSGGWELASASLFLLPTPTDNKIGWLVGALAASVFVLTLLLITVAVCRCRNQARPEKCNLGNPRLAGSSFSKDPSRYTDPPSKIDFQFREVPGRTASPETLSGQHQHIYERVDRYVAPTTCKSIYENVD
uniref:Uncharacterized protein n=1 Tax=Timema tahoe TaxID=61484 RepID=A0A7R9IRD4_9NEOP|nr:unnamed protein product [Timema tahoe]